MKSFRTQLHNRFVRRQRGLSMVELMVAITISLLLLAGVIQIFLASRQTYTLQDGMSRLQENARYALERISQDISRSAYLGCANSAELAEENKISNILDNQAGGYNFAAAISGTEGTGIDNTDTLVVRYATTGGIRLIGQFVPFSGANLRVNSADPNYGLLRQYDILTLSDCESAMVFMITNDPRTSGGIIEYATGVTAPDGPNRGQSNVIPADARVFPYGDENDAVVNSGMSIGNAFRTSVATYLVDASSSGNGNSLYVNTSDPENELIQGVTDFQVTYGVNTDTDLGADRYVDANDVVTANTDWNDVVSVRITLDLDTVDPVQNGHTIEKSFITTIRLRNRGDVIL